MKTITVTIYPDMTQEASKETLIKRLIEQIEQTAENAGVDNWGTVITMHFNTADLNKRGDFADALYPLLKEGEFSVIETSVSL